MTDEELQNIINEAQASRGIITASNIEVVHGAITQVHPVEVETQHLDEDETEDVISEMLSGMPIPPPGSDFDVDTQRSEEQELQDAFFGTDAGEDINDPDTIPYGEAPTQEPSEAYPDGEPDAPMPDPDPEPVPEPTPEPPQPQNVEVDLRELMIPTITEEDMHESTSRFSGAEWFQVAEQQEITFAGLGGIGSWGAFILSRIHPAKMYLYDGDTVEVVNMSGQLYGNMDTFQPKADAIGQFIRNYADYYQANSYATRFTDNTQATDIMISGFDSMAARKMYFTAWLKHLQTVPKSKLPHCLYIDARMSAEELQIYCMTGADRDYIVEYRDHHLFTDEEADAHLCSYKQTTFCAAIMGGLISNLFVNFCTNLGKPLIDRPLPFLTTYDASLLYLNVRS